MTAHDRLFANHKCIVLGCSVDWQEAYDREFKRVDALVERLAKAKAVVEVAKFILTLYDETAKSFPFNMSKSVATLRKALAEWEEGTA